MSDTRVSPLCTELKRRSQKEPLLVTLIPLRRGLWLQLMTNVFKKQKERLMEMHRWRMEQGDLPSPAVSSCPEPKAGECSAVLEQGEGGISSRSKDTSQQRRDSSGRQSLSHCCIQLLQPHSGNLWQPLQGWEWDKDGAHEDSRRLLTLYGADLRDGKLHLEEDKTGGDQPLLRPISASSGSACGSHLGGRGCQSHGSPSSGSGPCQQLC